MDVLVRKVSAAKWKKLPADDADDVAADAVTGGCIRTTDDTLSFWATSSNDEAVMRSGPLLAIAMMGQRADTFHAVVVTTEELDQLEIAWARTAGRTPVTDLRNTHVDAACLRMTTIMRLARLIATKVRGDEVVTVTRKQVVDLIAAGVRAGRVDVDSFASNQTSLRDDVVARVQGPD